MAVRGIDIAVGQLWTTARGKYVGIIGKSESSVLKWKTSFRMPGGEHALCNDLGTMTNLDELVSIAGSVLTVDLSKPFPPIVDPLATEPLPTIVDPLADGHDALTFHALPVAEPEQSNEVMSAQTNDGQPLPSDEIEHNSTWINWGGGDCPVAPQTNIEVRLRYGIEGPSSNPYGLRWSHRLGGGDIVAYRIVQGAVVNDGQPLPFDDIQPVGIGDITSTAKGSGARYNTGKPPLDLVPLSMLAAYHQHRPDYDALSEEQKSAIAALDALGMFQAREGNLLEVLYALGDGWGECAQVFEYGRRKYAAWNWAKGMAWSAPIACAARHLLAIIRGEHIDAGAGTDEDPGSGLPHRGHVFCNIVMLGTYMGTFTEGDDRPAKGMLL